MPISEAHSGASGCLPRQRPQIHRPPHGAGQGPFVPERSQARALCPPLLRSAACAISAAISYRRPPPLRSAAFPHPQAKRRGPQKRRSALLSGEERMKTNLRSARNSGSYKDNLRFPIRIEGNARGHALRFVFGQRRRRRLAARVIPLVPQTAVIAVCGLCSSPGERTTNDAFGL